MSCRITETEVRNRLKNITSVDISDDKLKSIAYIPLSEAYIDKLLSNAGYSYSSLASTEQTIAKGAQIALTCKAIVTDAPVEDFKTVSLESKQAKSSDKISMAQFFDDECKKLLSLIDVPYISVHAGSIEGDDVVPDGEDKSNVLIGDTTEDIYSLWK